MPVLRGQISPIRTFAAGFFRLAVTLCLAWVLFLASRSVLIGRPYTSALLACGLLIFTVLFWTPFFRRTRWVALSSEAMAFRSLSRTVKIDADEYVRLTVRRNGEIRVRCPSGMVILPAGLPHRDAAVRSMRSVSTVMETPLIGYSLGAVHLAVACLLVAFVVYWGFHPELFDREPQRIVQAIHQYRDATGRWPERLEQLKPAFLSLDVNLDSPARDYDYRHDGRTFMLRYQTAFDQAYSYRSDRGRYFPARLETSLAPGRFSE